MFVVSFSFRYASTASEGEKPFHVARDAAVLSDSTTLNLAPCALAAAIARVSASSIPSSVGKVSS